MAAVAKDKTKTIRRWYLWIDGKRIYFRTKRLVILAGKAARYAGADVYLFEEYDLFDLSDGINGPTHIDHREFDRSILIDN